MSTPTNIELGRPARPGQLILERRFRIASELIPELGNIDLMLDLGCGNGAQTIYFTKSAKRLIGVDVVPINRAESSVGTEQFDFFRTDAGALPFKTDSFDVVTAFEVLEHFPSDELSAREVARVLKPSGKFLFSVPNKWWLFESHGASIPGLNWLPLNRIPFVGWLPDSIHSKIARARIYTMKRAIRLARSADLKVIRSGYITAPLDVLPDGFIRMMLRKTIFTKDQTSLPFYAVNLFVICQKNP